MNLDTRVDWAQRMLTLMDKADKEESEALESRIGELKSYRDDIQRWSEMLTITGQVESFSRKQWLNQDCEEQLSQALTTAVSVQYPENRQLQESLKDFIKQQSGGCRENEYLPNSSEVLESLFGKQKYLEGEHANRGFSGLILSMGAMVSDLSCSVIKTAMETAPVKKVIEWQQEFFKNSLQARRIATNLATETEQKST